MGAFLPWYYKTNWGGGNLRLHPMHIFSAFAQSAPLIMEVQPDLDYENPDATGDPLPVVVIYGMNFDVDDFFTFGTYDGYLDTTVPQALCIAPPDPPPLDDGIDDYACVVGGLPYDPLGEPVDIQIPDGDYLIEVWVESEDLSHAQKNQTELVIRLHSIRHPRRPPLPERPES